MKKTCYHCKNYIDTLSDPTNPTFHIHNWCTQWRRELDTFALAGQFEYEGDFFDDLETGDACCYMFEPVAEEIKPESWFDANKQHNLRNVIKE